MHCAANHTYDYRLVGGKTVYEGHLEIRRDGGVWGPVVANYWSSIQASKACYELGFSGSVLSHRYVTLDGTGLGPVHVVIAQCPHAHQEHLMDCDHTPWDDPAHINKYEDLISLECLPGMAVSNSCFKTPSAICWILPKSKGTVNSIMTCFLRFFSKTKKYNGMRLVTVHSGGTMLILIEFKAHAIKSDKIGGAFSEISISKVHRLL